MTEYDYSPEAWERYLATQNRIARWVDGTLQTVPCNAFTPATPAVQALALQKEKERRHHRSRRDYDDDPYSNDDIDYDDLDIPLDRRDRPPRSTRTHHRKSKSSSKRNDRSRSRSRERDRERSNKDKDTSTIISPTRSKSSRHRSNSYSSPNAGPQSSRSYTVPPPSRHPHLTVDVPPFSAPMPTFPTIPSPKDPYYPQRYSGHSSHSSNTMSTRPNSGSTSYNGQFPPHQLPRPLQQQPFSTPPGIPQKPPMRSQTMPMPSSYVYGGGGGGYTQIDKNGYPIKTNPAAAAASQPVILPLRNGVSPNGPTGVPINPYMDPAKAPQLPYSAYQYQNPSPTKQVPLLRRLFGGLGLGGGKQVHNRSQSYSKEKGRDEYGYVKEKEGSMFLGGGHGRDKGMRRKRSSSF